MRSDYRYRQAVELTLTMLVLASLAGLIGYFTGKHGAGRWYHDHPQPCVNFTPERHWP